MYGKRIARHLKETNPERNPTYKAKMVEWVQKLVKMHSEVVLFTGETFGEQPVRAVCALYSA